MIFGCISSKCNMVISAEDTYPGDAYGDLVPMSIIEGNATFHLRLVKLEVQFSFSPKFMDFDYLPQTGKLLSLWAGSGETPCIGTFSEFKIN